VRLVGFTIEIYYDARSYKRQASMPSRKLLVIFSPILAKFGKWIQSDAKQKTMWIFFYRSRPVMLQYCIWDPLL